MFRQTLEGSECGCVFHIPTGSTKTSSHGTEHRIDYARFLSQIARSSVHHPRSQGPRAPCDDCVGARLHFEKDATRCDVCTNPSRPDKAKCHISQLIDMFMLHDERQKPEFRKRLSKQKCPAGIAWKNKMMAYSMHFAILPSEPPAVLAKYLLHPGFRNARGKLFSWEVPSAGSCAVSGNVPKRFL